MNAAHRLHEAGQSLWLDNITRKLLASGQLSMYIANAAVTGLTSNPTIFDEAIKGGDDYDAQVGQLASDGLDAEKIFFDLALDDIRNAAALFRPAWESSGGVDGWVSLEVSPELAHDADRTVAEAKALHQKADAPNVFIKVPGNREGLMAIEELIFHGIPVNVTLLFSADQYLAAADAYQRGLLRRQSSGYDLTVASVASLFVSRWDRSTVDHLPADLKDELGIAVAKQTYRSYRDVLESKAWQGLASNGACPQRLLFASTGTKDPAKPDTYYIEALAAPNTINTIPPKTLEAFVDHGKVGGFLPRDGGDADDMIARIEKAGVDVLKLSTTLQTEGEAAFSESWRELLESITSKTAALHVGGRA